MALLLCPLRRRRSPASRSMTRRASGKRARAERRRVAQAALLPGLRHRPLPAAEARPRRDPRAAGTEARRHPHAARRRRRRFHRGARRHPRKPLEAEAKALEPRIKELAAIMAEIKEAKKGMAFALDWTGSRHPARRERQAARQARSREMISTARCCASGSATSRCRTTSRRRCSAADDARLHPAAHGSAGNCA